MWRLKKPEENTDEDTTVPTDMSLSALIPPTSPCLSLKASRDEVATVPTPSSSSPLSTSSSVVPVSTLGLLSSSQESYGGSDEGHNDEKPAGIPRTTEHPHLSSPSLESSPASPDPSSPLLGDAPSLSLSSRRKKRKGMCARILLIFCVLISF